MGEKKSKGFLQLSTLLLHCSFLDITDSSTPQATTIFVTHSCKDHIANMKKDYYCTCNCCLVTFLILCFL
jgi:hypothetical protein